MRRVHWVAGFFAFAMSVGPYLSGCFSKADDCEANLNCGQLSGPGAVASSSTGAGGGGPDAKCVPSMNSGSVGDECGVFVALGGDDTKDGTKASPVGSLTKAIELANKGGGAVYACAQVFQEAVEIPAGVSFFGGLECQGDWGYSEGKKTTIEGAPDGIPLRIVKGAGSVLVEDVLVKAADATVAGGSSIAVIVDGATVELTRCGIVAGNGMAGDKGATPLDSVGPVDPTDPAIKGKNGTNACMGDVSGNPGGEATANALCDVSIGGKGGTGGVTIASGGAGANGEPAGDANKGLGGAGDTGAGCDPGGFGQPGAAGMPGAGAADVGVISASGYTGAAGAPGADGNPGQGGGGGGGAKGKAGCNGASGGGGGAGGCGGKGGQGGLAGGASIALISINAKLTFNDVNLTAGNGGAGGDGGDGQDGGIGGIGGFGGLGMSTLKGCSGGEGGSGGLGGKGGGGRGGHSVGIAFTGSAPTPPANVKLGTPGVGGIGADMTFDGMAGEAAKSLEMATMP